MAEEKGIKETVELLRAGKDVAVLVYRAQKGGGSAAEIAQRIVAGVMANPQIIQDLKEAFDGAGTVPSELTDLSFVETFQLLTEAGRLAQEAAQEIKG